jgi:UDP-2,3-diacylglucosamine hydrolase
MSSSPGPLKRVFIFSDLHLTRLDSPLGNAFLRALDGVSGPGDAVVLAGDVFEVLVGNSKYFLRMHGAFFEKIRDLLERGVSVHYIEGNHDFHLCELLPSAVRIHDARVDLEVEGPGGKILKIRVEHGDLVDQDDRGYLLMRTVFRSGVVHWLARVLPGAWIEWLATGVARAPAQKESDLPNPWNETKTATLRGKFREHAEAARRQGIDFVVMGHCHDLDEWGGFYWNMGYPPVHRQFLVYESPGPGRKETLERRNFL